ncbi:4-phosphoerythronate dehydrogenase [bacterium]|nr:MAG: 4-phosphoerythronate dehydrogenase [bacterium]
MSKSADMLVIADPHIYQLQEHIGENWDIHTLESTLKNGFSGNESAILVRTVTKVNKTFIQTFPDSIRFLATASAGFDHIDKKELRKKHIHFAHAPGCNSKAVAEYVLTGMLLWADANHIDLSTKILGIIGVGNVGKEVDTLAKKFNIKTVLFDPPREKRSKTFHSATFDEVLSCDMLTFHVPYDASTHHLFNEKSIGNHSFDLVINAARGGVIDEEFLLKKMQDGTLTNCIIDCWENEPKLNPQLVSHAFIATPHIAGYSEQAKIKATAMVTHALNKYFGLAKKAKTEKRLPNTIVLDSSNNLSEVLTKVHPIRDYDAAMRLLIQEKNENHAVLFAHLRTNKAYRNEYKTIEIQGLEQEFHETLRKLGVRKVCS